jgi:dolichol-phosphate mannosyltransferase
MEPKYTIIAPIYNEKESLNEMYKRVSGVMDTTGEPWELILVDDGSRDGSTGMIRELAKQDERVQPVIFARNFGHQIAVTAGMDHSRGQAVIVIDADLQDPPEVILQLIEKWKEGYQVVYAVRSEREGETWFKKATAAAFYRLIFKITDVDIPLDTGDFRLLDREVVDTMGRMREHHRFLRGMSSWVGYKQVGVPYRRAARYAGETKYPLKKMIKLAMNAITGFSYIPLEIATYLGTTFTILSLLALIIFLIIGVELVAYAILTAFFLGGVQLITIGIIGEYIGRIYDEVKGRPLYVVEQGPSEN